jgi:hypothetical protein
MELLIIFVGGFLAALFGSMAGGGAGFFGLYPLLFLGLPLNTAIATNAFGSLGFLITSIRNFALDGLVKKKIFLPLLPIQGVGIVVGTYLLINLNGFAIKLAVSLVILPAFVLLAFWKPKSRKVNPSWKFCYIFYAVYSGLIGTGSGSLRTFILITLRKITPLKASANGFLATLPFSLLAVGALIYAGLVDIRLGVPLLAGNLIGAHFGSNIAIRKGNSFIRKMLLAMMLLTVVVVWII